MLIAYIYTLNSSAFVLWKMEIEAWSLFFENFYYLNKWGSRFRNPIDWNSLTGSQAGKTTRTKHNHTISSLVRRTTGENKNH